jgi:ATP-dependent DNA helicase PIF1
MRLEASPEDQQFASWLLQVGDGEHTDQDGTLHLPQQMVCQDSNISTLIAAIFPNIDERQQDSYFADRAILSCRNVDIKELNALILDCFPGTHRLFHAANQVHDESGATDPNGIPVAVAYPPEYLAAMDTSGLPVSELQLKVGAPVMVLRNLDPSNGVCNGSRAIIVKMSQRVLHLRLLSGQNAGQDMLIPRINLTTSEDDFPFTLERRQFPVRLAFAMTINKSQGQSMKNVGIDLRVSPFTHGQLYVALSRCTSASRIKILLPQDAEYKTVNVVYREVLLPSN